VNRAHTNANSFPGSKEIVARGLMYKKAREITKIRKTDDFEILPVFNILRV
tara:strand:+ start:668 stop:820 length:153 start_codon:yes stop_codon:yes gene_type:complete